MRDRNGGGKMSTRKGRRKKPRMDYNSSAATIKEGVRKRRLKLNDLPLLVLSIVASKLNLSDLQSFMASCRAARMAVYCYWNSCKTIEMGTFLKHLYPQLDDNELLSLEAVTSKWTRALRNIPSGTFKSVSFHPTRAMTLYTLLNIEESLEKSSKDLFGKLEHLDIRGCTMDMPELLYFSNACPSLKSIAITQEALFFPDDFNPLKNNKTTSNSSSPSKVRKFREDLQYSLAGYKNMLKNGRMKQNRIELLAKLLHLFPLLEKIVID